ncbi:MAG: KH domain-containing protein [Coriobacteriia bacterium]|nr:KH domain-containing protein [Coriobacteriia bacterium]MCL2870172.1 KH domain-containing protein [Coriobacteriia bacterium]
MSTQVDEAHIKRVEELARYVIDGLVDNPGSASIETSLEEGSLRIIIEADPEDVGKIIGRGGRTIKSIRTLARASVATPSLHVDIDVEG